jgi:hypothetical protein
MHTLSRKKTPAKSLETVLAAVEADIALVVADIAAHRKRGQPPLRPRQRVRREPAHAA